MKNKKILFLSSRLPYPPIGGDRLKNYYLLKILTKHFKVHLVSIAEEEIPKEFYTWANEIKLSYKIFKTPKYKFYLNTLKSLINFYPLQVNYYYFQDIQKYINEIYKNYNLLFATLIRTANYVINKNKPKILDMADSIALNYKEAIKKTKSLFWKGIYKIEFKRLSNFEKKCIEQFDKTLFFNKNEAYFYRNYFPQKVEWIPHGVDESLLSYNKFHNKYKNCIAFFGKMNYQPNIDAVLWFTEKVLPYLNKNINFLIIGAYPTKKIRKLEKKYPNVKVLGYVSDPYEILKSCLAIVAPMQTGGGIQNKVLQTMALGTINILTSLPAKPIGGKNGSEFLVVDDPLEMAKLINEIYENPQKFEQIKYNAREHIKKNFTWKIYEENLLKIIQEVLK